MRKKKSKKFLSNEVSNPTQAADSLWSRLTNRPKSSSKGGAAIQKMLGIEDAGYEKGSEVQQLKMLDLIGDMYEKDEEGEEDEEK